MNIYFVRRGVLFGCLVLDMWIIGRTLHPGLYLGVPLVATPFLFFMVVGFVGARMSGSFSGGIALAVLTGLVSAASVLGDYVLFHLLHLRGLQTSGAERSEARRPSLGPGERPPSFSI
jgi:hypothetical protein